jgi:PAS domain S-box-containing protein
MLQDVQLSEEQFHLLYGNAPVGVAISRDGFYLYANRAFAMLFGYETAEELLGTSILTQVAVESRTQMLSLLESIKQGEQITGTYEVHCTRKSGSSFVAHIDAYHIPLTAGQAMVTFVTDITEQKEMQQLKDDFLSMVSHELRTPLTTVKAFTQILQKKLLKERRTDLTDYLKKMDQQIDRITGLITTLLDLSCIQEGKIQFTCEPFDIDEVVAEAVNLLQSLAPRHRILIEGHVGCPVIGDAHRIEQALLHLLSNAVKYSPQNDTIIVHTRLVREHVVISVQDFGIGIASHHQSKIFERFYRVYEDKNTTYPGLGIGLYLSREIIARHAGHIWVESAEGRGATFSFSLPLDPVRSCEVMQDAEPDKAGKDS